MAMDSTRRAEEVISDLFVALKTCQQEYGNGSRKVASENDPRVQQLLEAWLSLFSHGLSPTLCRNQFPNAWLIVSNLISSDEVSRLNKLESDDRRLDAWVRYSMNDRVFDKYLRLLLSNRSLLQKYYEPWSAMCLLSADPSAIIQLTTGCLATILFSFSPIDSSSTIPLTVPSRPVAASMTSIGSAVSASSYNDVLSAWAAGASSKEIDIDEEPESLPPLGESLGNGLVPITSSANVMSGSFDPSPSYSSDKLFGEMVHSSSRQSFYNSPSQGGVYATAEPHSGSSATESIGHLSSISNGNTVAASSAVTETPSKSTNRDNRSAISLPFINSSPKPALKSASKEATDDYSYTELKQLLLNILQEKQTLEKSNSQLEGKVTEYRDRLVELEANVDALRRRETDLIAAHQLRISAAAKENDILKQQLKKYIAQLQNQTQSGNSGSGSHSLVTNGNEETNGTSVADRKVLELSEMHGELLEFVEKLQARLRSKETRLANYRRQLTALRGPLPCESEDDEVEEDNSKKVTKNRSNTTGSVLDKKDMRHDSLASLATTPTTTNTNPQLVHVWVPMVYSKVNHHIYQIYLRVRDDEWNCFKRYSELFAFHQALKRRYPGSVGRVPFPPKKSMGNKKPEFVENRRQSLQTYLRTVFDLLTRSQPEFARLTRAKLLLLLPFLDEKNSNSTGSPGLGALTSAPASNSASSSNLQASSGTTPRDGGRTYAGL